MRPAEEVLRDVFREIVNDLVRHRQVTLKNYYMVLGLQAMADAVVKDTYEIPEPKFLMAAPTTVERVRRSMVRAWHGLLFGPSSATAAPDQRY